MIPSDRSAPDPADGLKATFDRYTGRTTYTLQRAHRGAVVGAELGARAAYDLYYFWGAGPIDPAALVIGADGQLTTEAKRRARR